MTWRRQYLEVSPQPVVAGVSLVLAVAGAGALLFAPGTGALLLGSAGVLRLLAVWFGRRIALVCSIQGFAVQLTGQPERTYGWEAIAALDLVYRHRRPSLRLELRNGLVLCLSDRTARFEELVEFVMAMTPHLHEDRMAGRPPDDGGSGMGQISHGKGNWYA